MAQEAPQTVRLTKEAAAALKELVTALQANSLVPVNRNAAINFAIIEAVKRFK